MKLLNKKNKTCTKISETYHLFTIWGGSYVKLKNVLVHIREIWIIMLRLKQEVLKKLWHKSSSSTFGSVFLDFDKYHKNTQKFSKLKLLTEIYLTRGSDLTNPLCILSRHHCSFTSTLLLAFCSSRTVLGAVRIFTAPLALRKAPDTGISLPYIVVHHQHARFVCWYVNIVWLHWQLLRFQLFL